MKPWLIGLAVLLAVPIGFSAYSTFSTVVSAPSRVINKTLETNNIITNYEAFIDIKNNFDARMEQINTYKTVLEATEEPAERSKLRVEVAAMEQTCRELAAKYNANSAKMNRNIFKDNGLPETLSIEDCNAN